MLNTLQQTLTNVENELNASKASQTHTEFIRNFTEKSSIDLQKNVNILKQSLISAEKEISLCLSSKQTSEIFHKKATEEYLSKIKFLNLQLNISDLQILNLQNEIQLNKITADQTKQSFEEESRDTISVESHDNISVSADISTRYACDN